MPSHLFREGDEETVEKLRGGVADVTIVASHPLRHVGGGTQARSLSSSGEEAGGGGRAGETATGGRGEGVVPQVVPANSPRATVRQEGGYAPCASGRRVVPTGGAGGGDTGYERVGEGDEVRDLAERDAERGSGRRKRRYEEEDEDEEGESGTRCSPAARGSG